MLNADLTRTDFYTKLDKSSQAGFKKFRVVTIPKGTLIFKMTWGSAQEYKGRVSPWWSAVRPFLDDKEGALGRYMQAKQSNMDMTAMVRLMSCVCIDWNDLDNYVQVELLDDAKAFWGTFAPMPKFSQATYKIDWKPDEAEDLGRAIARSNQMKMKEKQAGFKVPETLGGNKEAWQMYIPNLTDAHIRRSSVISGHDMHALGMALGYV